MRKIYFSRIALAALMLFLFTPGLQAQITLPYAEDLESEGTGSTGCNGTQTFTTIDWMNTSDDDQDWTIDINGTGSSNTGPTANGGADHNPGVSGGKYLYIEASGCALDTAHLVSEEIITLGNEPNLFFEFWYHQFGQQINVNILQIRTVVGGNPGAWVGLDTMFTAPPGIDAWQQNIVNLSAYVGDTFQLRFRGVTGSSFGSDNALDDFSLYYIAALDAGAVSIDAPVNPITVGANQVEVSIGNFGADTLTSAMIGWSVNGAVQTPVSWTGSVPTYGTDGPNSLGSFTFAAGLSTICAWTSMPNGAVDSFPVNDTVCFTACTPLSGVYTLGGAGADISDFTELSSLLNNCGIDSHVVVNVNPGIYNESLDLLVIPGTSDSATVTINGMDTTVARIVSAGGATIALYGTDYVTVKNLTIQNTGATDAWGVQLNDTATFNTIDSCHIIMNDAANTSDCIGVGASNSTTSSFTEGQNAFWTTVSNCHIQFGEKGIHFEGQFGNPTVGNVFMNNWLDSNEDYGFYMDDQDSITIWGNTIEGLKSSFADGIYCFDLMEFNISYNQVINAPDVGIYVADGNFDFFPTSRAKVVNNMVSAGGYGMFMDDVNQVDIWHNTFYSTSANLEGFYNNDLQDANIQNNIFWADGGNAVEFLDVTTSMVNLVLNYNVYFTGPASGANFIDDGPNFHATLAAWQTAAPAYNVNSIEGDPVALSETDDLHMLGNAANDVGNNTLGILDDIDGDVRPQSPSTTVDIGADEFTPLADDAVALEIMAPTTGCGDSNAVVTVVIRSLGQNDILSLPITVNYSGAGTGTLNFTYSDTLGFNEYDTVDVGTVNTYAGGTFDFTGFVVLAADQDSTNDTFPPYSVTITPYAPIGMDGYGCGADSAYLYGMPVPGVQYLWYANQADTTPIAMGDSFMVPSITSQSSYWLQYASSADSLTTTFAGGNGQVGNMFDLVALQSTQILSFAGNMNTGTHATVNVWYRPNSYTNNPNSAVGWTLLGTGNNVVSNGNGVPTQIPVPVNVTIPAGQTYGFYIEYSSSCAYTNGTTVGAVFAQNANFQFLEGLGKGANFASNFSPRVWNGVIYYGAEGCSEIKTMVSATQGVAATVNLGADTTYCDTVAMLDAGNPTAQWWMWNNGDMSQMTAVTTTGLYDVTIKDTNNCKATDTVMVTIAGIPATIDLGPDTLLCDGASITLDAGAGFASYSWTTGGTAQTETTSAGGTVTVTGTDSAGCTSSDDVIISALNTPTASFTSDSAATGCPMYDFMDTSSDSPTSWNWDFGDAVGTSTMQNPSYTYTGNGSYTVTLTVGNACGTNQATGTVDVSCLASISDPMLAKAVSIYPNPNNGTFQVELDASVTGDYDLRVVNLYGQEVFAKSLLNVSGMVKEEVSLNEIAQGVYFVEVSLGDRRVVHKIVVE